MEAPPVSLGHEVRLEDAYEERPMGQPVPRPCLAPSGWLAVPGAQALEPVDTIAARTLMVIIRGCGSRDDADGRVHSASKLDGAPIRLGHQPAKFGATF